jgi:hypothetical protein
MGCAGSGKTTMATIITWLAGGHVFILDKHNGEYSTTLMPGAYVGIAEDAENSKVDIPPNIFHALLGRDRNDTNCALNMRRKFTDEKSETLQPMSLVVQCNFPKAESAFEGSQFDHVVDTVLGPGSAMSRRVVLTPPQLEILVNGTANATHESGFRYSVDPITKRDNVDCEIAFIFVLLAATNIMGNAVAHQENGMMGDEMTPNMAKSVSNWLECGKNVIGHLSATVNMFVQPSSAVEYGALIMRNGIDKSTLRKKYKESTGLGIKAFPEFLGECASVVHCKHCNVVYSGLSHITSTSIRRHHATLSDVLKHNITRKCPNHSDACCDSLVTGFLFTSYEFK